MHKKSLKRFLRDRRDRIAPETVGKSRPAGQGRRAPGLSQHQVDELLGQPINTCYLLENGRNLNPSDDLLRAVARLYQLDEHEWVLLYRYAREEEPPRHLYPETGYQVPAAWQPALDGIEHMAYVCDAAWDVIAHNKHWASMFPSGQIPQNVLRWMCLSSEARTILTDWEEEWAPRILPQLRGALAARRDPTLQQLEHDVLADPVAGPLYEAPGVTLHPDGDERPLDHATYGPGWVTMCSASPESAPGARLMILVFNKEKRLPGPRTPLRSPAHTEPTCTKQGK
ncbi:helix-turn-helix domain-containing protein [Streptomyces sp. NPDC050529]|uniref:MmyB family transcriptional regulator n=1 Tax=Streptomyces sp. NPDC050529 TaxID=3365624 RepID=UPI00378EB597